MFSKFSPIHKKVLQNHFHVILSDLSLDAPGGPWRPLYAPVSKYYFFKCSQNFHPPPLPKSTAKSFSSHFKRFVPGRPWTPLYAPVCPYAPVSKHVLLDEPGRRGVSPPPTKITDLVVYNKELSHWYKVDKVFYTPEAKLRCVKITSYITKRS